MIMACDYVKPDLMTELLNNEFLVQKKLDDWKNELLLSPKEKAKV